MLRENSICTNQNLKGSLGRSDIIGGVKCSYALLGMKFTLDFELRAESADGLEVGELKVADTGIVRVLK